MHLRGLFIEDVDLLKGHQGQGCMLSKGLFVSLDWVINSYRIIEVLTSIDDLVFKLDQHGLIKDLNPYVSKSLSPRGDEVGTHITSLRWHLLFLLIL